MAMTHQEAGPSLVLPAAGRMPGLQGLRAAAIAGVFLVHLGVADGGYLGVTLFFVLSGFLITTLLTAEVAKTQTIDLRRFYTRRVARLAPAGVLAISLTAAFSLLLGWDSAKVAIVGWIAGVTYLTNWASTVLDTFLGANNFAWSLAQEEQYYLFAPLLIRRVRRRSLVGGWLLGIAVALMGLRVLLVVALPQHWYSHYHNPIVNLDGLLVGTGLALILSDRRVRTSLRALSAPPVAAASLGGLALVYVLVPLSGPGLAVGVPAAILVAVLLLLNITHRNRGPVDRLLSNPIVTWVGDRSYGLYLYQILVLKLVEELKLDQPWTAVLTVALTVCAAELSYRYLEEPIRKLVRLKTTTGGARA